jgi:hypothetical protein
MRPALKSLLACGVAVLANACSDEGPTGPSDKGSPPTRADVSLLSAPANDNIADATALGALPFSDQVNTAGATTEPGDPDCVGNGPTVWYRFTPSQDIVLNANTFGSDYDTSVSVYIGSPGSLTQIACNDDSNGMQSSVTFEASAGETYYVMVGAFASGFGGNLTFTLLEAPPLLETDVTIAEVGSVNAATGVATLRGTVSCSREATAQIQGQLRQRSGRIVLQAEFFTWVECDGTTPWSVDAVPSYGLFAGGRAQLEAYADVFDPLTGEAHFHQLQSEVRLRGQGKGK